MIAQPRVITKGCFSLSGDARRGWTVLVTMQPKIYQSRPLKRSGSLMNDKPQSPAHSSSGPPDAPLPMIARDIAQPFVTRRIVPKARRNMPKYISLSICTFVSMTARRKRALGRELRDTVLRLCLAAGVSAGILWDLRHPKSAQRPASATCSDHAAHHIAASQVGQCVGNEFSSALAHWLIPIGIGLLVGMFVGVVLASMIRLGRDPSRA